MDLTYLNLIAHPESVERDGFIARLAAAGVADAPTLRHNFAQSVPLVVGLFPAARAAEGQRIIRELGGDAFICTLAEIESLGPTRKIREIIVADGHFDCRLWRGEPEPIAFDDVRIIVRASLRERTTRINADTGSVLPSGLILTSPGIVLAEAALNPAPASRTRQTRVSEKIDLYTSSAVFQVDGDKFAYSALGGLRAHSDKRNMDALLDLLRHFAPSALIDEFFPLFKPPPRVERMRLPGMTINNEDPVFAFYSRWVALMYRHMGAAGLR